MKKSSFLLVFLFFIQVHSFATTNISGQIRSNTTWTKSGSPYICTGLIEVAPDVTLSIEPGTTVVLDKGINIHGNLTISSTINDSAYFQSNPAKEACNISYLGKGSVDTMHIKYCHFNNVNFSASVAIRNFTVSNCVFTKGNIYWGADNGSLHIYKNMIDGGISLGPTFGSPVEINDNFILGYVPYSIQGVSETKIKIHNNYFANSNHAIYYDCYDVEITNNTFYKHQQSAITPRGGLLNWTVKDNVFTKMPKAINIAHGTWNIVNNTIYDNEAGVVFSSYGHPLNVTAHYNCIYNNSEYNVKVDGVGGDLDFKNNWWGTTDTAVIEHLILDYKEDFKKGPVNYQPILAQLNPDCRNLASDPTSSKIVSIPNKAEVAISPNPFSHTINIKTSDPINQISIVDVTGRKVYYHQGVKEATHSIDARNSPNGIYIYNIVLSNNTVATGKIIKQ